MEDKAIRGVPWTLLAYAGNKAITVATTLVLARLLTPQDFGVVALALLMVVALSFLRDLGLNGALVIRRDLDARALGTILTLMIGMGAMLAAALAAVAPLLAALFREPRLDEVVAVLAISVLLGGFTWFYETLLQRELEFRRRFVALTTQSLTNAAVALPLATAGAGVWSLVAAQIAATVSFGVALLALAPQRIRPAFDLVTARDVVRSGTGFLVQGLTAFVQQNADYLAVGRFLGSAQLGYYSMAYRLAELPYYAIADPVARVTFPAFARMRERGEDIRPSFLSALRLVALASCFAGVILSGAADPFVRAVLGDKWLPMIGPLTVLGLWGSVRPIQVTLAWLLNSVNQAGLLGRISFVFLMALVPAVVLAAVAGGITAVAWVVLADGVLSLLLLAWFARSRAELALRRQLGAIAPVAVACAPAWLASRAVAVATASAPAGVGLALSVGAGLAAYAAIVLVLSPETIRLAVRGIGRTMSPVRGEEGA